MSRNAIVEGDAFTACKYGPEAESHHDHDGIAAFNESVYFNFLDPVSHLGGALRVGNRPNLGYSEISINLILPGGAIAFRAGREQRASNADFRSQGLEVVIIKPTREAEVTFDGTVTIVSNPSRLAYRPGLVLKSSRTVPCQIALKWTATCPMFVLDRGGSGRLSPGGLSVIATDHFEQFGVCSGTVRIDGNEWRLNAVSSMRDHSWGERQWASYTGDWICAYLADGTAMTVYAELEASGSRKCNGAVVYAGRIHRIKDYETFTDYDGGPTYPGRHRSVVTADDLPQLVLDGEITHFVPLNHATGENKVRVAQMVVSFIGPRGGWAWSEWLRPF